MSTAASDALGCGLARPEDASGDRGGSGGAALPPGSGECLAKVEESIVKARDPGDRGRLPGRESRAGAAALGDRDGRKPFEDAVGMDALAVAAATGGLRS